MIDYISVIMYAEEEAKETNLCFFFILVLTGSKRATHYNSPFSFYHLIHVFPFSFTSLCSCAFLSTHGSCSAACFFLFIMKPYAEKFYKSKAWQNTRNAYWSYRHGLCEICLSKGRYKPCEIVHHKIQITPENINDPTITLNWDNLQCVCRDCHAMIHEKRKKRFKVDDLGRVIIRD